MKRVADSQLTKDTEDGDDGPEEVGIGFKKASDSELVNRRVKALPKRASLGGGAIPQPANSEQSSPSKPKFAGFSGFGSPVTNSNAFTFSAPIPTPTDAQTKLTATPSFPSNFSPAPPPPTFAPGASTAQKFTSFVNSNIDGVPKHPLPTSVTQTREEEDYNAAYSFYKSIRGLNHSIVTFLTNAVKDDPFVDLSQVFDQYAAKRRAIQSVWDKQLTGSLSNSPKNMLPLGPDPGPSILFSAPNLSTTPASTTTSAPKLSTPPSPITSGLKPSASANTPSFGSKPSGFAPPTSTDSSKPSTGFVFPSIPTPTSESSRGPPAPTFGFGSTIGSDNKSSSTIPNFFSSSLAKKATDEPLKDSPKPSSLFGTLTSSSTSSGPLFGGSSTSTTTSLFGGPSTTSAFGFRDEKEKGKTPTQSPFGSSSTTDQLATTSAFSGFGSTNTEKLASPFGGFGASTSSSTVNPFGGTSFDKDKPTPSPFGGFPSTGTKFTFGASSTSAPGTSGGSLGNPVGFTFGSPPKTSLVTTSSEPTEKKPFTFTPVGTGSPFSSTPTPTSSDAGDGDTEAVDHTKILEGGSVHDQEGEGEEDEETIHSVKAKVYSLNKEEGAWKELGLGVLKVKRHKEAGARRLLLRNSSTGKITINFRIHAAMKPSVTKQVVSLMGHDDKGNGVPYRLRVKTEQAAQELKDVLDKEMSS
ncbi:hypothetical protein BDM02DRAFT_3118388 [Thelephora ganbajun]|uniref:Uncharacterized protein n=1 Tax=Thelephora ganbajun TaxID=370292 RepID=A0ACB6ZA12_THEGA|nr:hypothetical protein BDM02DRAFT_3118388 [Thelephora ganbajun]